MKAFLKWAASSLIGHLVVCQVLFSLPNISVHELQGRCIDTDPGNLGGLRLRGCRSCICDSFLVHDFVASAQATRR